MGVACELDQLLQNCFCRHQNETLMLRMDTKWAPPKANCGELPLPLAVGPGHARLHLLTDPHLVVSLFSTRHLDFHKSDGSIHAGEEVYSTWVPFLGTIFLSIFVSNWSGALECEFYNPDFGCDSSLIALGKKAI